MVSVASSRERRRQPQKGKHRASSAGNQLLIKKKKSLRASARACKPFNTVGGQLQPDKIGNEQEGEGWGKTSDAGGVQGSPYSASRPRGGGRGGREAARRVRFAIWAHEQTTRDIVNVYLINNRI